MPNYPATFLKPPPAQDGEYLNTLEQWGDLPQYLTIPNAARFIGHSCKQNPHAIEKIIIKAVVTNSLPFAGLKSNGEWEAGMYRLLVDIRGKPRLRHVDDGIKFKFAVADIGSLHVEAMGVMVSDVLGLLIKRGRKIPEELRHMLPALDATPLPPEKQDVSGVDRSDSAGMVAWQGDIIENKVDILNKYGNAVSARDLMSWCKTYGSEDVFKRDQPKCRDSLQWLDSYAGDVHTVTYKTVGSQLSDWRKAGVFPPRK